MYAIAPRYGMQNAFRGVARGANVLLTHMHASNQAGRFNRTPVIIRAPLRAPFDLLPRAVERVPATNHAKPSRDSDFGANLNRFYPVCYFIAIKHVNGTRNVNILRI